MSAQPTPFAIDERLLPPVTRRIVGAIGVAATMKLLKARGGIRLWLPKNSENSEILTELLGPQLAAQLVEAFPDERVIKMPKADKLLAQIRDDAIRAQYAKGDSQAVLAIRYDLTDRQIENIVKSAGRAPIWRQPEPDLFDTL